MKDFGFFDAPLTRIPSYPHFLISGPKYPPEFASPHVCVKGDFPAVMYLPLRGVIVPVNNPGKNARIASGDKGSTFAGIFS